MVRVLFPPGPLISNTIGSGVGDGGMGVAVSAIVGVRVGGEGCVDEGAGGSEGGTGVVAGVQAARRKRSKIRKTIFFTVDSFNDFIKSPPDMYT